MPATVAQKLSAFTWDARNLRYRRAGQFVSARTVKLAVRRVIRGSQADMRELTDQLIAKDITVADWRARMQGEVKNLHVAGAMAGQGGPANMTPSDYLRVARALKAQYRYLRRFAEQVDAGELDNATIRRRSEMYVNGMNGAYEAGRQASAIAAGYTYERNVLGDRHDHCRDGERPGCFDLTRRGWVAIGTMPPIGARQCLSGCGCSLKFKR